MARRNYLFVLFLLLSSVLSAAAAFGSDWRQVDIPARGARAFAVNSGKPQEVYLALRDSVFFSPDGGGSWEKLPAVNTDGKQINRLLLTGSDDPRLFAATEGGLYCLKSGRWARIYYGKDDESADCLSVESCADTIYVGTAKGLYYSRDKGRSWQRPLGVIEEGAVRCIVSVPGTKSVFAVCENRLYLSKDEGESWKEVFSLPSEEVQESGTADEGYEEPQESIPSVNCLAVYPDDKPVIYMGTSRGIYYSRDDGQSWHGITSCGLIGGSIVSLRVSSCGVLFAMTERAVFMRDAEAWKELTMGVLCDGFLDFYCLDHGPFYILCPQGLFLSEEGSGSYAAGPEEPGIRDVQEAAIRYAEVDIEKIRLWRRQLSRKPLLPKVSVGLGRDAADLWHWEGGSTTKAGDDVLVKGEEIVDWSVSLSWDLSELIWSSDQTSIDVRSRLLVELRDDIIDEVTRIYFERLREKMELYRMDAQDPHRFKQKKLRIEELTAMLDGMTGGYFSGYACRAK